MKIGIEAQRIFRPKKHGMDVVAIELIKNLQQIDKINQYVIFARDGVNDGTLSETFNFSLNRFGSFTYADWEQIGLPKAVRKEKINLLHCTANTAPLSTSVPLIVTLHDIIYLENVDFKGTAYQNLGNLYRRFIVPKIVKKAGLILTVSHFERENIIERLHLPADKVQVLYNGVSSKFNRQYTKEDVETFRKQFHLPEKFIMFLGNTAPKKNTRNVIKAFAEYCLEEKNIIPLVLLDYKKEFVSEILATLHRQDLIDHFIFPGYIPHQQIALMYNAATLFLYPSLRESFGLPILEAMACGVPVITSTTSSMPEIAGDAARLVDPYNYKELSFAISTILGDESLQKLYTEKGLERVKQFTWKASAEKLVSLYESLR
ncbi:MAG TPA: glycosyltransferase family 1 protein [Flavisolibacter sp.]|nr:glycosyltransferase family 1 protein [Flavisolibacter sp.]